MADADRADAGERQWRRFWEWWFGVSQTTIGTLLAAGIGYVVAVFAGVATWHLAIIVGGALLGVGIAGVGVWASRKITPVSDAEAIAYLAEARRLLDAGKITRDEWRRR